MSFKEAFIAPFAPYIPQVESMIRSSIPTLGPQTVLRDACEYALLNGGKRIRPAIVLMIAAHLPEKKNVELPALAVEYFHTASLIADDLPCMDNDDTRRDVPTLHRAFNEGTAILSTYALIASGYEKLNTDDTETLQIALKTASKTTGILGATGGQYLDLFPPNPTFDLIKETLEKKTATLFELSFVLGWLFGGGDKKHLHSIQKAANHFGMAFQILDDFMDLEEDEKAGRKINLPSFLGKEKALKMLEDEVEGFCGTLKEVSLKIDPLRDLITSFPSLIQNSKFKIQN